MCAGSYQYKMTLTIGDVHYNGYQPKVEMMLIIIIFIICILWLNLLENGLIRNMFSFQYDLFLFGVVVFCFWETHVGIEFSLLPFVVCILQRSVMVQTEELDTHYQTEFKSELSDMRQIYLYSFGPPQKLHYFEILLQITVTNIKVCTRVALCTCNLKMYFSKLWTETRALNVVTLMSCHRLNFFYRICVVDRFPFVNHI